jgi:hypothetical protein
MSKNKGQEDMLLSEHLANQILRGLGNTKSVHNFSICPLKTWGAVRYIIWYTN